MSAEVMFSWKGTTVNLKLARSVVRFLAEHHGRLAEVGPTQCLRDILDWFQHCDPDQDDSFRALEQKHGNSADFDNVCSFLREYDYEDLKRAYPKQCGSLWMAVRGVLRRMNQNNYTRPADSTMNSRSSDDSSYRNHSPTNSVQSIREGSDDIAFELLMLLSHPETLHLSQENREHLEHAEQTLLTAVEDVRLILRHFRGQDNVIKTEPPFDESGNNGGNSGMNSEGPSSPDSAYPSSPGASSSGESSGGGGFASGNGGNSMEFSWYANLMQAKLAAVSISGTTPSGSTETNDSPSETTPSKRLSMNRLSKRLSLAAVKKVGQDSYKRLSTKSQKTLQPSAFESASTPIP